MLHPLDHMYNIGQYICVQIFSADTDAVAVQHLLT